MSQNLQFHAQFSCVLFLFVFFFFLMHNFKTSNNFSPKICCENAVDVKKKKKKIKLGPTTAGNKKILQKCYDILLCS